MTDIKEKIEELRKAAKSEKDAQQRRRYSTVWLYLRGYTREHIADIFELTEQTIRDNISLYEENGMEGLKLKKSPGRRKKLTDEQETELYTIIETKTPNEVGFEPFMNWTAPIVCKLVEKRYHVKFSERGMRNVFDRIKLSYTRPTYTLEKADPKKQEEFKSEFETCKKN